MLSCFLPKDQLQTAENVIICDEADIFTTVLINGL